MQDPIIITGIPRSGTSLTSGIIELCGAFGGNTTPPNKHNPKGMFENDRIRNELLKPYFADIRYDPRGQYPLPKSINNLPEQENLSNKLKDIIKEQGYEDGKYYYKGAKIILIWPVWKKAFPNSKWVLVRRNVNDIADSCARTSFMDTFSKKYFQSKIGVNTEKEGWKWWAKFHIKRINEMLESDIKIKQVWPSKIINGDFSEIKNTVEWLGLDWNKEKIKNFIEPKYWNNKDK